MEFSWSSEQLARRKAVIDFAQTTLNRGLPERDRSETFDFDGWRACAEMGLQGACVPKQYGGQGQDVMTAIVVLEALGYGCRDNGLSLAVNGQMWSVQEPLLSYGTETQKSRYLPKLCSGQWSAAHGMTEPESGSDAFALETTATKVDGGYVLNGHKAFVGLAPIADLALVFAATDPRRKQWGISAFLVESDSPGYQRVARSKMGLRSNPFGDILLNDVFVPDANRLGPEGAGATMFQASMEWERSFIAASFIGAMEYQLDSGVEYAKKRHQFGQPIGKFQSVANRLADMKVRLETARLLLYRVAWLKDRGESAAMDAAIANLYIAECFADSSMDAMRNFGARGYLEEFDTARDLRDALGGLIYSGTSDVQRVTISRLLGL